MNFYNIFNILVPIFMRYFHNILYMDMKNRVIELRVCLLYENHVNFT